MTPDLPTASPVDPSRDRAHTPKVVQRIGIIDLGSNTARLVVYHCEDGRFFRMIDSVRERVRLAEGLNEDGTLKPVAIDRALAALELFNDYSRAVGLDALELVATSAIRDAVNRDEILEPLRAMGFEPRILDGPSEAAYGVLAVANTNSTRDAWVVDQGGGSLQLSLMKDRGFENGEAYPVGTLRLAEAFLQRHPEGRISRAQVLDLEDHLQATLGEVVERLRADDLPIISMGGTVRSLASVIQRRLEYPLELLHGYQLGLQPLESLTAELLPKSEAERALIPGLSADRADVIAAGALTFRWLLRKSRRRDMTVSGVGLREGALLARLLPAPHLVEDVASYSVNNLFRRYPQPSAHTENVRSLALRLFDDLEPLHHLDASDRSLLDAAAVLHDIGMIVSYYRHHRYGAFLLEAAGVPGISHRDLALLSLIIRYHRNGTPRLGALASLLDQDGDEQRLWVLTACLRLAEHLERSRTGRIKGLEVTFDDKRVTLHLEAKSHPTVEIWGARKDEEIFRLAFARELQLEHRGAS